MPLRIVTFPILLANMGFDALVITNSICIVITNASSRNLARRIGNVLYEGFQVVRMDTLIMVSPLR